jgi:beta-aspartyl-peptidase (threonine type)
MIRAIASYEVARLVGDGVSLADAATRVLDERVTPLGGSGGLIALGSQGGPAMPFTTVAMYRGWRTAGGEPRTAIGTA